MTQELEAIEQAVSKFVETIPIINVDSPETEALAASMLVKVRTRIKELNVEQKSWTDPLEQQKRRFFDAFRQIRRPLEELEALLVPQLTQWRAQLEAAVRKEEERLRRLQEKRNDRSAAAGRPNPLPETIIPYVPVPDKTLRTESGSLTYTKKWKAEVVNCQKFLYTSMAYNCLCLIWWQSISL